MIDPSRPALLFVGEAPPAALTAVMSRLAVHYEVASVPSMRAARALGDRFECALVHGDAATDDRLDLGQVPVVVLVHSEQEGAAACKRGAVDSLCLDLLDADRVRRIARWTSQLRRTAHLAMRLQEADRLAVIGRMAAGIAHELNNPIAWLRVNQDTLTRRIEQADLAVEKLHHASRSWGSEPRADLRRLLAEGGIASGFGDTLAMIEENHSGLARVARVSSRFSAFVRASDSDVERIDITQIVREAVEFARPELRHRATVEVDLPRALRVNGRRGELTHLLVNLLGNACRALDRTPAPRGGHRVHLSAVREGEEVVVRVEDTGMGIPEAVRDKVFEPFFSTWTDLGALGLGLSTSRDLATQHGGSMHVDASELGGALFELRLPRRSRLRITRAPSIAPDASDKPSSRLRLLLVDDEPNFLAAMRRCLRRHDVQTANSAEEALQLLAGVSDFDGVLCDLMMDGMDGIAFCAAVRKWHPHLADSLVLCTGGAVTPRIQSYLERHPTLQRLHKPVEPTQLDTLLAHWAS